MSNCKGDVKKALFFVQETFINGWSRNVLLKYMQCFYVLYSNANLQQVVEDLPNLLFNYLGMPSDSQNRGYPAHSTTG